MTSTIPGQQVFPELADDLGFESAALPPKQERFCWEFVLKTGGQAEAYQKAFPGVSLKSAAANASRLLKDPKIQARITQIKVELQSRYAVSADRVVFFLSQVLNVDRSEFLDDQGNVLPIGEIPTEAKRILDVDFQLDRHGKQRAVYRLPKRLDAATELAKIMGLVKNPVKPVEENGEATGIEVSFVQPGNGITDGSQDKVRFYIPENNRDAEAAKLDELRKRFNEYK